MVRYWTTETMGLATTRRMPRETGEVTRKIEAG
jgi:hypothetical protein